VLHVFWHQAFWRDWVVRLADGGVRLLEIQNEGKRDGFMKNHAGLSSQIFCIAAYCFMFSFLSGRQLLQYFMSVLLHEAGHILSMLLLDVPLAGVHITMGGIKIQGDFERCSFLSEALVHFSGPLINILVFLLLRHFRCYEAALGHAAIAVFNLIPLPGHDGYRALFALTHCARDPSVLLYGLRLFSLGFQMVLAVFSAWLFWFGAMHDPFGTTLLYGSLFFSVMLNIGSYARWEGRSENEM